MNKLLPQKPLLSLTFHVGGGGLQTEMLRLGGVECYTAATDINRTDE